MAWNEPNNGKDHDPWGGKQKPPGPPDLDRALRELRQKLANLLKKTGSNGGGAEDSTPVLNNNGLFGLSIVGIVILGLWLLSGIFIVEPAERGVILRFGKYIETIGPGPHWIPRLIESVTIVNEQKIANYAYEAQMLTKDENIVSVALAVQYRISNAKDFLFNVVNSRESLQQATASALRQVIGRTSLDLVLTSGRDQVRQEIRVQLEKTLQRYHAGLLVTDVAMQPAKAPEEVKEAFDDAIKAQEDEQRFVNQAQAYERQVEPIAKGQAQRLLADAKAYKQQVIFMAKGDIARYLALLPEYQRAPGIMRDRLYLDTMEYIFQNTPKVIVDTPSSNNMLYLPLDKLLQQQEKPGAVVADNTKPEGVTVTPTTQNIGITPPRRYRENYGAPGGY